MIMTAFERTISLCAAIMTIILSPVGINQLIRMFTDRGIETPLRTSGKTGGNWFWIGVHKGWAIVGSLTMSILLGGWGLYRGWRTPSALDFLSIAVGVSTFVVLVTAWRVLTSAKDYADGVAEELRTLIHRSVRSTVGAMQASQDGLSATVGVLEGNQAQIDAVTRLVHTLFLRVHHIDGRGVPNLD